AERALPDPAVLLPPERSRGRIRRRRQVPLVEHPERTGRYAVAAAVADVLLDDDRLELRPEERARRADVEARRMRAVLADVGAHQPAKRVHLAVVRIALRLSLLDERDVPPGVRPE